jgi:hypothetical protein
VSRGHSAGASGEQSFGAFTLQCLSPTPRLSWWRWLRKAIPWPCPSSAAAWGERWPPVAATKSGRRGLRKRSADEAFGDGLVWPIFSEQIRLRSHLPEAEQRASERRAAALVERGWGCLRQWLEAPAGSHPGEGAQPNRPTSRNRLADVFDDVAA